MTKGNAWKSPFLLSTLVFVAGMAATICFSYFFFEKAEKDWNVRVDQTAERLSNTLLAWLEESYAPVSGLVALVENSKTVEPNEFLNAFESMQSRSTTVLLDEASLVRLNRLGRWQADITSDTLGYPGRYIQITDVAQTLSLAAKRPNQFTLSPPFKSAKRPDYFSDCSRRFGSPGNSNRSGNVELRYPAGRNALRTGSEGYLSRIKGTLSWSARPKVRSHTSERPAVPAHINHESGERRRRYRNLMGGDTGV